MSSATWTYPAKVRRIVDGDTYSVDLDLGFRIWAHDQHIRLAGLDAPEDETPEGKAAAEFVAALLPVGADLTITTLHRDASGTEVRSFERWVAHVHLADGRSLADVLR